MHRHWLRLHCTRRGGTLAAVVALALVALHIAGAYVLVLWAS